MNPNDQKISRSQLAAIKWQLANGQINLRQAQTLAKKWSQPLGTGVTMRDSNICFENEVRVRERKESDRESLRLQIESNARLTANW